MDCQHLQTKQRLVNGMRFDYQHRCGQCMACRIRRRDEWVTRILLESAVSEAGSTWFVTLTYANPPRTRNGLATLWKPELQRFLKRLRKIGPKDPTGKSTIRYFGCGEYGDETWRPHYHLVIFGLPHHKVHLVKQAWPEALPLAGPPPRPPRVWHRYLGRTGWSSVTPLSVARARYVAAYTTKALTQPSTRLAGRAPEFALMSRKPGLATGATSAIWASIRHHGMDLVVSTERSVKDGQTTVPDFVRYNGKLYRLDFFLKTKLASYVERQLDTDLRKAVLQDLRCHRIQPGTTSLLEAVERQLSDLESLNRPKRRNPNAV